MDQSITKYNNINVQDMTDRLNAITTKKARTKQQIPSLPSTHKHLTNQEHTSITRTINGFNKAIKNYETGNKQTAALSLIATYKEAEQNNTLSWIDYVTLERVHNLIAITHADKKINLAIEFAEKIDPKNCTRAMITNRANLYRKKAKEELHNKNYNQAKEWHEKALEYFKQTAPYDQYTEKRYNATIKQYLNNLTILADSGDMEAQRTLAYMYTSCEYNTSILPEKTDKSIEYHQQYLLSMARLSSECQLPKKHFTISLSLKISCPMLQNYLDFFSARLINDTKKISTICSPSKTVESQELLILQTLSQNSKYLKKITLTMPNDQQTNELTDFNKQLLIQELALQSNKNNATAQACSHLLGLHEFSKKNYAVAYDYFIACSSNNENLLAQCLAQACQNLNNESHDQISQTTPLSLLIKTLLTKKNYIDAYKTTQYLLQIQTMEKTAYETLLEVERAFMQESPDYRAQLTELICRNDILYNLKNIVKKKNHSAYACHCLGHLFSQQSINSEDSPTTIKSLKKQALSLLQCTLKHESWLEDEINSITSLCLTLAIELSDYRQQYQLKRTSLPTKKMVLRSTIEDLLSSNQQQLPHEKIMLFMPNDKELQNLFEVDGPIIIPLLMEKLASLPNKNNHHADALRYIVALYEYSTNNNAAAHDLFTQCINYKNDLSMLAFILETSLVYKALPIMEHIISLITSIPHTKKLNPKDKQAKEKIINLMSSQSKAHAKILLDQKEYSKAYQLAYNLIQLKETRSAGILILFSIEEITLKTNSSELLTIPYRLNSYKILKKNVAKSNHEPLICYALSSLSARQAITGKADENKSNELKKESLKYFHCTLNHQNSYIPKENIVDEQLIRAYFAHQLGEKAISLGNSAEALTYFDKAIQYGHANALFSKVNLLINTVSENKDLPQTILNLLKQHANSNASNRILSCIPLIESYLPITNTIEDKKELLHYLSLADELDNHTYTFWLGFLHEYGIKNNLEPDMNKALYYYKKHLEYNSNNSICATTNNKPETLQNSKKLITDALLNIARILYSQEQPEEAYQYIKIALSQPLGPKEEIEAQWIAGCTKMLMTKDNEQPEGLEHFRHIYEKLLIHDVKPIIDPTTQRPIIPIIFMSLNSLTIAKAITSKIIATNDNSPEALEWCYIMGYFFCETATNMPLNTNHRQIGIDCLKHASQQIFAATFYLLSAEREEYSDHEKLYQIYTMSNVPHQIPNLTNTLEKIKLSLSPKTIIEQAHFALYIISKNNTPVLETYFSQIYKNTQPQTNFVSHNEAIELIEKCSKNELLAKHASSFLTTLDKSTPLEHYSALFLGSLLSYSLNEQELLLSMRYLQAAHDTFPTVHQITILSTLAEAYYKQGCKFTQKECHKPVLAVAYLQKAAQLLHVDAIILLSKQWLNNSPETKHIDAESILLWLLYVSGLKSNKEALLLLQRYKSIYPQKINAGSTAISTAIIDMDSETAILKFVTDSTNVAKKAYQQEKKQREFRNNPNFSLIINTNHSLRTHNKDFLDAVDLYQLDKKKNITYLEALAHKKNPEPHACIFLAMCYFQQDNSLERTKEYLSKGILSSLTKSSSQTHSVFMYNTQVDLIFMIIEQYLLNPSYKMKGKIVLKYLKQILLENNVNTTAFANFFQVQKNKNLTIHPSWK